MNEYLEIDSTFRNRTKFPNPASFGILISEHQPEHPVDPVIYSIPEKSWTTTRWDNGWRVAERHFDSNIVYISNSKSFIVQVPMTTTCDTLKRADDYFTGTVACIEINNVFTRRRIQSFVYLGRYYDIETDTVFSRALVTVNRSFPDEFSTGTMVSCIDPTDTSDLNNPIFFVPCGSDKKNAYHGYILYNEFADEYINISGYDEITRTLRLSEPINTNWTGRVLSLSIRKIPVFERIMSISSGSTSHIVSKTSPPTLKDEYKGMYYRVLPVVHTDKTQHCFRMIVSSEYNTPIAGKTLLTLAHPLRHVQKTATPGEILLFSHDNASTTIQFDNPITYSIQLLHIILPNKAIDDESRIYTEEIPYIYVELSSKIDINGVNSIKTNNPNSKVMFKVPMQPLINSRIPFIVLKDKKIRQTIDIIPGEQLRFNIYLPSGDILKFVDSDTRAPLEANEELQISAMFKLSRI